MKANILIVFLYLVPVFGAQAQPCTPQGNETSYGTNDVWIGYVYDNMDFTSYVGYVNEGASGNPNFDQSFGGDYATYATNGCSVYAETFSIRYKLNKTFADGDYEFLVGADDGFRLSIDGGSTWLINHWSDQSYTTDLASVHLNGNYNLVLEYYENGVNNRVSFNVQTTCIGTSNPLVYGTGDVWKGYVYDGINFNTYKGMVTEGSIGNPNFDESFGGDNVNYLTNSCSVITETFSVRYRLLKTFVNSTCLFIIGADDGYRLSWDGGLTWPIDNWGDHGYTTTTYNTVLNGTKSIVLEFYENGGGNRVSFDLTEDLLPIRLVSFSGKSSNNTNVVSWKVTAESNPEHFDIEKSNDGSSFSTVGTVNGSPAVLDYSFTDANPGGGTSYYRLKMIDRDGQITYSAIISIVNAAQNVLDIFPTIQDQRKTLFVKSNTNLQKASLVLYDMSGRKVMEKNMATVTAGQTIAVSLQQIPLVKGMYLARLQSAGQPMLSKKIIVL